MGLIAIWPPRKYVLVPVFQQTTLRMLQLAQQYQAAAGELKRDNQEYGRGPSADRDMREHAELIAVTLLRAQFMVLMQLVSMPWPEMEPMHSVFRKLYTSSEVPIAALQLLAGACQDLQRVYKDMARKQQLLKRKKKQQSGQQVALNPLLLKLTVPADHVNVGVPPGWEDGAVKPLGFMDLHTFETSPQAYVCQLMELIIRNHVLAHVTDNPLSGVMWLKPSQKTGAAQSSVCRPEVVKLLLEAALLLQATEPEAGLHHELQHILNVLVREASKEDALVLLRERGGLLMQAATLSTAEEWVMEGGGQESIPWEKKQKRQQEGGVGDSPMVTFDWMSTLVAISGQIGEFLEEHKCAFAKVVNSRTVLLGGGSIVLLGEPDYEEMVQLLELLLGLFRRGVAAVPVPSLCL